MAGGLLVRGYDVGRGLLIQTRTDENPDWDYIGVDFNGQHYAVRREWGTAMAEDFNDIRNNSLYVVADRNDRARWVRFRRVNEKGIRERVMPLIVEKWKGEEYDEEIDD